MAANLPGLAEDRLKWSYHQLFMTTLIWNVGLAAITAAGVWIVLVVIKYIFIKRASTDNALKESVITSQRTSQDLAEQPLIQTSEENLPFWKKSILVLVSSFFYLILVSGALLFIAAFMFGIIGYGTGKDVLGVFITAAIVIVPTILWKLLTRTKEHAQMKRQYIITGLLLLLWLGVSIMGVIMTRRACLCVFNERYGVTVNKDFQLSTQFTRSGRGKICKDGAICHVFATLPEDSDTSVFFNIQTGTDIDSTSVSLLEMISDNEFAKRDELVQATKFAIGEELEYNGLRNHFVALFNNLKPDTLYAVKVQAGSAQYTSRYRTLPSNDSNVELRVAFGGDVGMTKLGSQLTELLGSKTYDPHVLIIGGDISYDDAMPTCYYSWDNYYEIFEGLNNKLGRIVPMILTVGNHDVGFDAGATVTVTPDKEGPFFFAYHPQQYVNATAKSGIPPPENRSSCHFHRLGKILMINLDSGYLKNFTDQKQFIEDVSKAHPTYQKIANYHNPIYPTCSDTKSEIDMKILNESRTHWVPLFEQYKFVAAMEHHTHHLKYTFPILAGQRNDTDGIVYIGDGCWGVTNDPCEQSKRVNSQLFDEFDNDNSEHVWMMNVNGNTLAFKALDADGNTRIQKSRNFRA